MLGVLGETNLSNTERGFDTFVMHTGKGRFATKTDAEGAHAPIAPDRKIGIALKVEDGTGGDSEVALAVLLSHVGVIGDGALNDLASAIKLTVVNAAGQAIEEIRMSEG